MKFLSIDPGLKNCAAVIVEVTGLTREGLHAHVIWTRTGDLSGPTNPCPSQARDFADLVLENCLVHDVRDMVIEYQPPINTRRNPALVRYNSWVEAFMIGYFGSRIGWTVNYTHANAVKKKFDIAARDYRTNKRLAIIRAATFMEPGCAPTTDHVADCVLIAVYFYGRSNGLL